MANREQLLIAAGARRWRPHDIIEDTHLTFAEKVRLLESLELDLRELQQASDENMAGVGSESSDVAERLRQVRTVLSLLRH